MYVSKHFQLNDQDALWSLIESNPFAAWVCHGQNGLIANHIPFFLDRRRGPLGTLVSHVARPNDVWRQLSEETPSVVMFQGPQAYVTPAWYPAKKEHGKVVPTWNYTAVHVHGVARVIEDRDWLMSMLNQMTNANEAGLEEPWRVSDAPADYIEKQLSAIVGIEIQIDRIEGKLKASQNQPLKNQVGVVDGLLKQGRDQSTLMADLVRYSMAKKQAR